MKTRLFDLGEKTLAVRFPDTFVDDDTSVSDETCKDNGILCFKLFHDDRDHYQAAVLYTERSDGNSLQDALMELNAANKKQFTHYSCEGISKSRVLENRYLMEYRIEIQSEQYHTYLMADETENKRLTIIFSGKEELKDVMGAAFHNAAKARVLS